MLKESKKNSSNIIGEHFPQFPLFPSTLAKSNLQFDFIEKIRSLYILSTCM